LGFERGKLDNGIEIINSKAKEKKINDSVDVITMFEVLDHTSDPDALMKRVSGFLKKGGLCFLTAILASGFDLQMLWDKAENIFPPDRLNVFSVEGLKSLFMRHNLECLEFSTPGILDVEIVAKAMERYPDFHIPKFFEYILNNRDEECKINLQEFLQNNLLSSYGRILVRKS
jgi:SAM-dependent methyltransferase